METSIKYFTTPTIFDSSYYTYQTKPVHDKYNELKRLGLIDSECRNTNEGNSDYSKHTIQPWSIWLDYNLDPWDADIIKRILRTKKENGLTKEESRILDYKKIIHICNEKIRQLTK